MLFNKLALLAFVPLLAVATPMPQDNQECDVGSLSCCQSTQTASTASSSLLGLLSILGVVLDGITGEIGVTCSPITGVGVSGTSW
ncbi:hypothetical protein SCHPADRAFT_903233 [Schizopora paradoxa]|uniref:Hydrophobin n=1 Tax=Schizopora paradoxa TaxID=27342 RepID=A0A0H2RSI0_9AGAM|nr:hypothetical protein SCHPADRAFT_903233 [Schizopora paradoxa]